MLDRKTIIDCKNKLLETKTDILNRIFELKKNLLENSEDKGGDEADQTLRMLIEKQSLINQTRFLEQLRDIDLALRKIEIGQYGVCEETDEFIEKERLLSLPWTRLSIEGAEIRESKNLQFRNSNRTFPR